VFSSWQYHQKRFWAFHAVHCSFIPSIRNVQIALNTHNKQLLTSNTRGYGITPDWTDSENHIATVSHEGKLYYLPFSILAVYVFM
jgi:hypothetical protein